MLALAAVMLTWGMSILLSNNFMQKSSITFVNRINKNNNNEKV